MESSLKTLSGVSWSSGLHPLHISIPQCNTLLYCEMEKYLHSELYSYRVKQLLK